jgi:protein deglycase
MPRVLVPIAEGSEELEAITIVDLLRRAGIEVVVAGLHAGPVTCSRQTVIVPDTTLDDALREDFDMVVLPGGLPGANHLDNDARIHELLRRMAESGKFVGAICAAPKVLANAGLLAGKRATSYPGFLDAFAGEGVSSTGGAVECDGKIVTSRGPGTAMDFALTLIEQLAGRATRDEVEARLVRD